MNDASSDPDALCAGDVAITVSGGDNNHISALLHEAMPAGVTTHGDMTSGGARWFSSVAKREAFAAGRRQPTVSTKQRIRQTCPDFTAFERVQWREGPFDHTWHDGIVYSVLNEADTAGDFWVVTVNDPTTGGQRRIAGPHLKMCIRKAPLMATVTVACDEPTEEDRKSRTLRGVTFSVGNVKVTLPEDFEQKFEKAVFDALAAPLPKTEMVPFTEGSPADLAAHAERLRRAWNGQPPIQLDDEIDGWKLRTLLAIDEEYRQDRGLSTYPPNRFTPDQRAAVSAYWSAQLRLKMADAKKNETQVVLDCAEEM